jgi:polyisoprenoid-binding protein YceI
MLKKLTLLLLLISSMSFSQEWIQDKEETSISFKIKNFGLTVDGGFKTIDIKTNLDTKDISNSYVNAAIIVNSIFTGIEVRDKHLLEEDYFDAINYTKIRLESSKIEENTDGDLILFATLSIKGITKKIEIPIDVSEKNSTLILSASMTLNRKDFNVGGRSFVLSNNVKIQVEYSAINNN